MIGSYEYDLRSVSDILSDFKMQIAPIGFNMENCFKIIYESAALAIRMSFFHSFPFIDFPGNNFIFPSRNAIGGAVPAPGSALGESDK